MIEEDAIDWKESGLAYMTMRYDNAERNPLGHFERDMRQGKKQGEDATDECVDEWDDGRK